MWSTPSTSFEKTSGTPAMLLMPFSRRIGFSTSAWSTSSSTIGRRSAAIRPAKPPPIGIRTPCSTSSSSPTAARATSSSLRSSRRRTAAVSASSTSRIRVRSSPRSSSRSRCDSAASVTSWIRRRRSASPFLPKSTKDTPVAGRASRAAVASRRVVTLSRMSRSVIVATARTPFGKLGGGLAGYKAPELGRDRDQGRARAGRARAERGRVRDHGRGAPGGGRPGSGPAGRDRGGHSEGGWVGHGQQGLRLLDPGSSRSRTR